MKFLIVLLAAALVSISSGAHIEGKVSTTSNLWRLNYTIDTDTSMFHATVECRTNGWIGMGLSYDGPSGHAKTDSLVAWYGENGSQNLHDQYSTARGQPRLDTALGGKEDLVITGWRQANGTFSVTYMRPLDTKDANNDIVIQNKDLYVSWACGNDVPVVKPDNTISYKVHPNGQFGAVKVNLFNTPLPSTSSPVQTGASGATGGTGTAPKSGAEAAASTSSWMMLIAMAITLAVLF